MAKVSDIPEMTAEDYANLPPLVKKGEDREAVIEKIVTGWCTSTSAYSCEEHIGRGGFALERVALVDGNTGEPIDLGELVKRVEKQLRETGAPEEFKQRRDLHIILRGCRVDLCNCAGLKIRPRWTCQRVAFDDRASFASATFGDKARFESAKFGDRARFQSATFGDEASFDSATFGDSARFHSARFGFGARFDSATFGDRATFAFATFGDAARFGYAKFGGDAWFGSATLGDGAGFLSAKFGNWARFESATFGDFASFESATFGDWARFDAARFGHRARFESATFGGGSSFGSANFGDSVGFRSATFGTEASFDSAMFGDAAEFESATFGPDASFLGTRFGAGSGIESAVVARPATGRFGLRRGDERLKNWFSWTTVRSLGRLEILTKVSYLALLVVPILAGAWPAVRAGVNWVNDDIRTAARNFEAVADRLEGVRADLPPSLTTPDDLLEKVATEIRRVEEELSGRALKERDLPPGLVLAFFAALFVALGHLVYQLAASETIRQQSREAFISARNDEFRDCSEGQRRDLLTRAFPWLRQIAEALPGFRNATLVRRHDQTVWIPIDLEQLQTVAETSAPSPAEQGDAQGDTDVGTKGEESTENAGTDTELTKDPDHARTARDDLASERRIKFTRPELELVVVDEGARAEYDVAARERLGWAVVAGVVYAAGVFCIVWLVALQAERVLLQGGLVGPADAYNPLIPRIFSPLAWYLALQRKVTTYTSPYVGHIDAAFS